VPACFGPPECVLGGSQVAFTFQDEAQENRAFGIFELVGFSVRLLGAVHVSGRFGFATPTQ
jgi:hypothetical protein